MQWSITLFHQRLVLFFFCLMYDRDLKHIIYQTGFQSINRRHLSCSMQIILLYTSVIKHLQSNSIIVWEQPWWNDQHVYHDFIVLLLYVVYVHLFIHSFNSCILDLLPLDHSSHSLHQNILLVENSQIYFFEKENASEFIKLLNEFGMLIKFRLKVFVDTEK